MAWILCLSLLLQLAAGESYFGHSQACEAPDKSSIEWKPKANDTRIFNVGRDPNNMREIRVSVPPTYNLTVSPSALVIAFHDKEMTTAEFEYTTRLSDREFNKNAIVVYPAARKDTWQSDIIVRRWQKDQSKVKKESSNDMAWMEELLSDLDAVLCFDKANVHAVGMGTGAGMVNLLACNYGLSAHFASYSMVAGGFGTKKTGEVWAECNPAYLPIPILEIHGEDDAILPYYLQEWEPARSRMAISHFLEDWEERNLCGETESEPLDGMDGTGANVKILKLPNNGWKSSAEVYGGAVWRLAMSCPGEHASKDVPPPSLPDDLKQHLGDGTTRQQLQTNPEAFSLLHYRVKGVGHIWPTLRLKVDQKGTTKLFDATAIVLDWIKIHKLPQPDGEIIKSEDIFPGEATSQKRDNSSSEDAEDGADKRDEEKNEKNEGGKQKTEVQTGNKKENEEIDASESRTDAAENEDTKSGEPVKLADGNDRDEL